MYLFFDTETTGLPKKKNAPIKDLDNWPRIVQIAWLEFDKNGKEISRGDYIIKPNGFIIPEESSRIHKITQKIAEEEGTDLKAALNVFNSLVSKSENLVAHNIEFDENVIGAEFLREYISTDFFDKNRICTMKSTVDFVKIPSDRGGYRYPGLADLHMKLFGEGFKGAHNALVDIEITAKCFWELQKRGLLDKEEKEEASFNTDSQGEMSLF